MAETVEIPESTDLGPLLSALIGKGVVMRTEAEAEDPETIAGQLAVLVDDEDKPTMLVGGDREFAYFSGAALALIPKGRAEDALPRAEADADLLENYREVLNVVTRAVNDAGGPHVRLVPGSSPDPTSVSAAHGGRCYGIDIDGYGTGHLSFWKLSPQQR